MTLQQHPLSAAFPAMSADDFQALKDGLLPVSAADRAVIVASDWFLSLSKSQRAALVVLWSDWHAPGSNQHRVRISSDSPAAATRAMRSALTKAAA